jgi:hypothetical protein
MDNINVDINTKFFTNIINSLIIDDNDDHHPQILQNTKNMAKKLQATDECLLRLAVQADKGYTPAKLIDQNVDGDVTGTHLNTCKTKNLHGKFANLLQKITYIKNPPYCGFLQVVSILSQVFQSPSKTG